MQTATLKTQLHAHDSQHVYARPGPGRASPARRRGGRRSRLVGTLPIDRPVDAATRAFQLTADRRHSQRARDLTFCISIAVRDGRNALPLRLAGKGAGAWPDSHAVSREDPVGRRRYAFVFCSSQAQHENGEAIHAYPGTAHFHCPKIGNARAGVGPPAVSSCKSGSGRSFGNGRLATAAPLFIKRRINMCTSTRRRGSACPMGCVTFQSVLALWRSSLSTRLHSPDLQEQCRYRLREHT